MISHKNLRALQTIFKTIVSFNKKLYFPFSTLSEKNVDQSSSLITSMQPTLKSNNKENLTQKSKDDSNVPSLPKNSVSNASNTMVFAQYLPLDWDEKALKNHFDPSNSCITKIVLVKNRLGVYNGKALFEFVSSEVCEKFVSKWHENFIEAADTFRRIVFKPFELKTNSQKVKIQGGLKQVYLYNLDDSATADDVYSVASEFGEITQIKFPIHEATKKHKGYGFITFKTAKSAQKFSEFADGKEFFGKNLR